MVKLKFDYKIELKMAIFTIAYEANSRVSVAMVKFFDQ